MQRFDVVTEGLLRFLEPGEDAAVALVQDAVLCPNREPPDDLLDELALALARKGGGNLDVVEDPRDDQCLIPAGAVRSQRDEVGQSGDSIDESSLPEPAPDEHDSNDRDDEQSRG